ncbi:LrgB family protein [Litchfieldia alkalitelluris]|uniref:LrgB family protein n=1 Tax=Litchfieldia alkalitelluris TaxID=304268 RepID=UPI000997842F|nr:LrgB family protein [Litchfieldia alkalitelluris]
MNLIWAVGMFLLTISVFAVMRLFYQKYHYPLFVPIATTSFIIIVALLAFNIPYERYMMGGSWIGELLGPAVVALAYPLYQNKDILKKYSIPVFVGVFVGSTIAILSGLWLSLLFKIDTEILLSLIPKNVTTPIAMDLAEMSGGVPTLAAVFVMVAGVGGAMFGPTILKMVKVNHYIGVGVAFGTASHGIGTARALEFGPKEGAISSIAMILSALYTAIVCPLFIQLFL